MYMTRKQCWLLNVIYKSWKYQQVQDCMSLLVHVHCILLKKDFALLIGDLQNFMICN